MADRASGSIYIGGSLPRWKLPDLLHAISLEGAWTDFDEAPFEEKDFEPGRPLHVVRHELAWGVFETLEAFCQEQGLSYIRWSEACPGAFGAERVVYAGEDEPKSFDVNEEGDLIMTLHAIRRLVTLDAIEAHFELAARAPEPLILIDDYGLAVAG
jgi:hypothetical protein